MKLVLFANMRDEEDRKAVETERREPASIESAFMEERLVKAFTIPFR